MKVTETRQYYLDKKAKILKCPDPSKNTDKMIFNRPVVKWE